MCTHTQGGILKPNQGLLISPFASKGLCARLSGGDGFVGPAAPHAPISSTTASPSTTTALTQPSGGASVARDAAGKGEGRRSVGSERLPSLSGGESSSKEAKGGGDASAHVHGGQDPAAGPEQAAAGARAQRDRPSPSPASSEALALAAAAAEEERARARRLRLRAGRQTCSQRDLAAWRVSGGGGGAGGGGDGPAQGAPHRSSHSQYSMGDARCSNERRLQEPCAYDRTQSSTLELLPQLSGASNEGGAAKGPGDMAVLRR